MAKAPHFNPFKETDLGIGDGQVNGAALKDAFRRFFAQLNPALDLLNTALAQGLTFSENVRCELVSGKFSHGVAQQVALKTLSQAQCAIPLGADGQIVADWPYVQMVQRQQTANPLANVTMFFNDKTATNVSVKLLLLDEGQQTSTTPTAVAPLV